MSDNFDTTRFLINKIKNIVQFIYDSEDSEQIVSSEILAALIVSGEFDLDLESAMLRMEEKDKNGDTTPVLVGVMKKKPILIYMKHEDDTQVTPTDQFIADLNL